MNQDQQLKELAYKRIEQFQGKAKQDPYFPSYHIAPPTGLINDPNGWIEWKGTYHLFYQWMPFETGHGAKYWGHVSSSNLIDWKDEPIALAPSSWYDKDGCYSGSAIAIENKLQLYYTGNVKINGQRQSYQCLAVSTDGRKFDKKGVVLDVPEGYTAHYRDPKVWKEAEHYYMVLGAQTIEEEGCVVLYSSKDLEEWQFHGQLAGGFGYMWECPDFFRLGEKDVLLFSPQGIEADGIHYQNTFQSGYMIGNWQQGTTDFTHGPFFELDHGFDFYAPQTTLDKKGRRILIAWMGMADENEPFHPTIENDWIHQLTLPRELVMHQDRIYQKPVKELQALRKHQLVDTQVKINWTGDVPAVSEFIITPENRENLHIDLFGYATIDFDPTTKQVKLTRPKLSSHQREERVAVVADHLLEIRCYLDRSSLEIFVNHGELVFTARIFPQKQNRSLSITGEGNLKVWSLQ
ncbi:glycoside hydrolase family 32 protein [Gracilibacillus dipsosauri]|uniref:glycoside hydrolase family 32 protein n=1 Tax=Gracilibacillus dipsosauri TaxID=178340 RepID=UPI00240921BE